MRGPSKAFISSQAPDVLLITPLVDIGSPQLDHLAAAQRLGVRTVLPVASWDHLSSKSLLRTVPERVILWNERQRTEAIEMHGVPADRIVVTGAQCYDQWFDRTPALGYQAFCDRVGLRSDRPYILYVCSSLFRGTTFEPAFTERWIQAVRSSADPRLKDIGILVRPHPARRDEWKQVDLTGYHNVAFWGAHPVDAEAKEDYFDSLYYSSAVVGINTSAFIEAAVVGKPVFTVLEPEISENNQEGTLHLHYLLDEDTVACACLGSLDEHVPQLAAALAGHGGGDPKAARFVDGFVRPFGRTQAATPRFVEAVEHVAAMPAPERARAGTGAAVAHLLLFPLACLLSIHLRTQPWRKRTRNRIRKSYERQKLSILRRVKQLVTDQFISSGKRRKKTVPIAASTLTPKAGRQRDPAKTLAGTEFREAKEARELVTVLGRSGKPIILGPWLSETGFELLYWIPFLAWAKAYGNFDPDRLIVVSRGGAAPWYRHITPALRRDLLLLHPRRVPRRQRAAHRRTGRPAEAHRGDLVRSRDSRARTGPARSQRRRAAASIADVSAVRQLLAAAHSGHADRSVLGVHAAACAATVGNPRAAPRAICGRQVLWQRGAAADAGEPAIRDQLPRAIWRRVWMWCC